MMSGHVAEMMKAAALMKNVVATLEKPFLSEALVTIVQQTLSAERSGPRKISPAAKSPQPHRQIVHPAPAPQAPPVQQPSLFEQAQPPPSREAASVGQHGDASSGPVAPPPSPPVTPSPAPKPSIPAPTIITEQPIRHEISVARPSWQMPRPEMAPDVSIVSERTGSSKGPTLSAPVVSDGANEVVLGLFLEVVSMQLTPSLRMGTIRARPSSLTVSLHVASAALRAALPDTGFQLGPVDLDRTGRISAFRVMPTVQKFMPLETRNAFQIAGVAVVPENSHNHLQLTATPNAPMRMHLLAQLDLAGVELSTTFQISQLLLKTHGQTVRVTLNASALGGDQTGTICETAGVRLDGSGRIVELLLNPVS
jgi:hypothetical protein